MKMFGEAAGTGSPPEAPLFVLFVSITCRHSRRGEGEKQIVSFLFSLPLCLSVQLQSLSGPPTQEGGGLEDGSY